MRTAGLTLILVLMVSGLSSARAQSDDACGAFKWSIARERTAFSGDLPALSSGSTAPAEGAVAVTLQPQDQVGYPATPLHKPKSNPAYGAVLTAAVAKAGLYQVTLSSDAWVDLAQDGKTLRSVDFSGKTGCPGVRKSVRFTLHEGPVSIAISDAPTDALKVDLLPAE